jgi:hypothetical protein
VLMRLRKDAEDGVVLVTVLLLTMIMLIIVAGSLAYAVGSQHISRRDQDWNSALSAAEAGLDDYLFRLNENDQYYIYSASSLPPDGNQAFTTWVNVPNAGTQASFRYTADTSFLTTQGAIIVSATGRSRNATRTIQATLRRRSFIDYLYFTDYETKDPAAYDTTSGDDFTPAEAQTYCSKRYYEGRDEAGRVDFAGDTDGNSCTTISFNSNDTINGPLHSNDAIRIVGSPTFLGNVTTSYQPTSGNRWINGGGATPSFKPGDPKYAAALTMPPSNTAVKTEADKALGGTGCLFTGPTAITLNAAGTMTVVSPFTKTTATDHNNCVGGTRALPATQALPANGVVYVQNVPSSVSDSNYTAACITSTQLNAGTTTSAATVQHPLGYPELNDITTYACTKGDVFLKGTLKGRLTIAADNNIDVIDNVQYQGGTGGNDILGIVANNYVEIYHPVDLKTQTTQPSTQSWCDSSYVEYPNNSDNWYCNLDLPGVNNAFRGPIVQAAILSVQHSFRAQNYQYGDDTPLSTINVTGAIAQKYRGIVTLINISGYGKNYAYDQRLKYQSPPHFLNPIAAAWKIATWVEQAPAYAWNAP